MSDSAALTGTMPRRAAALKPRPKPWRDWAAWLGGAAIVGALMGAAIGILAGRKIDLWFLQQSILFSEVVAASALIAYRHALPLLEGLAAPVRYGVVLLTLAGGAVGATLLSILLRPGVVFSRTAQFLALVGANAVLAILVGGALIAWESLKDRLARAYEELRAKEKLEREIAVAREVQQELLPPHPPDLPGYEIAFSSAPAGMVGGDTFDFVPLSGGKCGVAIGDVVGKGVAAAVLMANLQALVRGLALEEPDPVRLNTILSKVIGGRGAAGRFVTFAYLILDPPTGEISYSVAGHHPPLIAGVKGVRLLEKGGLPLGLAADIPYEGGKDLLLPGEALVLYTDGLTESTAPGREEDFGRPRLLKLAESGFSMGAGRLLAGILEEQGRFLEGAGAEDDTTVIVLRRRPRNELG